MSALLLAVLLSLGEWLNGDPEANARSTSDPNG